ncbi:hypothetical protein HYC85_008838, partial [Camellia sinensis]
GKISLVSNSGVHQLHIFIFVLAVFHVLYSVIIVILAQAKMKKWKGWESDTSSLEYQFTNGCILQAILWFGVKGGLYNYAQWVYQRKWASSFPQDFQVESQTIDIFPLWVFAVILLLLNVYSWYTLAWISLVPLIILLLVGTKLELVIMELAQQIEDRATVVRGAPVVEPSNRFFWFNRPQWILILIHFTLFQVIYTMGFTNAFQMALFLWTWVGWVRKPSVAVQFLGWSLEPGFGRSSEVCFVSSGSIQICFARASDYVWYRPEGSAYLLERDFLRSSERGVCFRVSCSSDHSVARACSRVVDLKHCILGSSELFFARARFSCVWSLERPSLRSSEPVRFK